MQLEDAAPGIEPGRSGRAYVFLCAVVASLAAGLLAFSQTVAWYGDEGFHLLAAQLINAGKRPYIDFIYAQTPLYAYLNAAWMRLFGESWRSAHLLSALATSGAILLGAGFVFSRVREPGWRLASAMAAAVLMAGHFLVIRFGTIGQAYGVCLFFSMAAFRLALAAAERRKGFLTAAAGACAGAAASCSLLAATVAPVILVWLLWRSEAGSRPKRFLWFVGGAVLSCLPVAWLAVQAPRATFFNVFEYHFFHRAPNYRTTAWWDLRTVAGLIDSAQGLLLLVLALVGLHSLIAAREPDGRRRAESYLCAGLVLGSVPYLALANPTYAQYFVLVVPYLSILAALGVYAIGSRIWAPGRPAWMLLPLLALYALGLGNSAFREREGLRFRWRYYEDIAREVNRVTPKDGLVWADEAIYFAAHRLPPPGLEYSDSQKLKVAPELASALHVIPWPQLEQWVTSGRFDAVATCSATDKWLDSLGLPRLYAGRKRWNTCNLFWRGNTR